MYELLFFARKDIIRTKNGNLESFVDIFENIRTVEVHGIGPYYKVKFKEIVDEEVVDEKVVEYFAWKNYENKRYEMIYRLKETVNLCFAYGYKAEESYGKGKLVGLIVEYFEEI